MNTIAKATVIAAAALSLLAAPSCRQRQTASPPPPPKPRIATVDMQELFKGYYETAEAQKEINVERAQIQKENNERLARIKNIETELDKQRKQLEDPTLPDARKQALFKDWQAKQQEGIALDRERREFLQQRNEQLNEKMQQRSKGIMGEFLKPVAEHAKIGNYDFVSSSTLSWASAENSFLAYTGDAANSTDITGLILKEVNKDAPADSQPPKEFQPAASPAASSSSERNAASQHPKLRIAKVDLSKLVRMHYKTAETEKQIDQERAAIQQDYEKRSARLRDIETMLGKLRKQLEDPTLPETNKQALLKEWQAQQQESIALDRERSEFLKRRNQVLDEKSRQRMKSVSEEIQKIIIERCKAEGFDFVADRFAEQPSADGPFLFSTAPAPDGFGPMTDVTDIMLQEINKNAPAGFQPPSAIPSKQ